jgi:hypothetical protein
MNSKSFCPLFLSVLLLATVSALDAQTTGGRGAAAGTGRGPTVVSRQVLPDSRVIVRLNAPQAQQVTINGVATPAAKLSRGDQGIWEATLGPVADAVLPDRGATRTGSLGETYTAAAIHQYK